MPPAELDAESRQPSIAAFRESIERHARYSLAQPWESLSPRQVFECVSLAVRDLIVDRRLETERRYRQADAKHLYYLSIEYLLGRMLTNNLSNLGIYDLCRDTLRQMGVSLEAVEEAERDAALGNGGLGRLAACFLDSLATLDMPGYGYGINYEYGLFRQEIDDGYQKEKPDNWLAFGTPWEIERPEEACLVPVYGRIEHGVDRSGRYNPMWLEWRLLIGVPHDVLVVGYGGRTVNLLRLFSARSSRDFDMQIFNTGDYLKAVEQKIASETISKVLYPSDAVPPGQELRLLQEYFLVACAVRDLVARYQRDHQTFDAFPAKVAVHLNDTHPALAIAELMRILVDERDLPWDTAWQMTQSTMGYTNHTLLPEALEKWPVALLERVVPRHLQIIYEINRRFLAHVASVWPGDDGRLQRMSLIEEGDPKQVRMAHLSIVGSHSINGVSALHSRLVQTTLARDFYALWPERFNNKTNGVTPRRWLVQANPLLAGLITRTIGDTWITDLERLRELEPCANDSAFRQEFSAIKRSNKERLARVILQTTSVTVDPDSLFDVQVKRIHEYKRQLLNVMRIVHEYLCLIEDGTQPAVPRTYIFAGKAAPGYWAAKQIIKLICSVGSIINNDPRANGQIKVVFVPDFRVSLAETIIPGADLSEQISTAGSEASGTGNMKLAMNGALTIGTLDGANVEMLEAIGAENMFIFGLTADQIQALREDAELSTARSVRARPAPETDPRRVRLQPVLSEGARTVSLDRRVHARPRRRLFSSRGPAGLHRRATPGRRRIQTAGDVGVEGDSERGADRQVLERSNRRGVRQGHLGNRRRLGCGHAEQRLRRKSAGYVAGMLGIAAVTAICAPFHETLNDTTVALAYLLVVLLVATAWGSWPALLASVVGVLCFNFFFLPPVYTLTIADPQNWVALAAFLVTAVTAGQLSELAKRRAAEAEAVRTETRLASAHNRSLLEASLDALVTIGSDGKINDVNSAIETLTGRSRPELIGTDFSDCFVETETARAAYEEVLREGFVRDRPLEIRHRDGHLTSVLYNASLHRDDAGKVIGVVAAARSISTSAAQPSDRAVGRQRGEGPAPLRQRAPASFRSRSDCSG